MLWSIIPFKTFSSKGAGASANNTEKELKKHHLKLKKYMYICIKYLQRIFAQPAIQCKWQFLQIYINFVKFSEFEGSIS